MKRLLLPVLCLILAGAAHAAPGKKKPAKAAAADDVSMDAGGASDKKKFEAYLKQRLAAIGEQMDVRDKFIQREMDTWKAFWSKVKEERKLFEIRMAQQLLSTSQSLTSLDPAQRVAPLADFERMQAGVVKSFETQQKQKMTDFFAARDQAWKEFAAAQEQEREEFVAAAAADWQRRKAELTSADGSVEDAPAPAVAKSGRKSAKAAPTEDAGDGQDAAAPAEDDAPPPPKKRPASKPKAKAAAGPMGGEDGWH